MNVLFVAVVLVTPWGVPKPAQAQADASVAAAVEGARRSLTVLDRRLALRPTSVSLRLQRLRHLYVMGVQDRGFLEEGDAEIERIRELVGRPDLSLAAKLTAYSGAYEVVRAKHASWPFHKLSHVRTGLDRLDAAVVARPEDPEIRYLRLTSCHPLPFFLDRGGSVERDVRVLARLLADRRHRLSAEEVQAMASFLLTLDDVEVDLRRRLTAVLAETAVGGGA